MFTRFTNNLIIFCIDSYKNRTGTVPIEIQDFRINSDIFIIYINLLKKNLKSLTVTLLKARHAQTQRRGGIRDRFGLLL